MEPQVMEELPQRVVDELFQPVPYRCGEREGWRHAEYEGSRCLSTTLPFTCTTRNIIRTNSTGGEGTCQPSSDIRCHLRGNERLYRRRIMPCEISKHKNQQQIFIASPLKTKHDNGPDSPWEGLLRATEIELNSFLENEEEKPSTVRPVPSLSRHLPYDQGGCDVRHHPSNKSSSHVAAATMDVKFPTFSPSYSSSFGQGSDVVTSAKKRARDDEYDSVTSLELESNSQTYEEAVTMMYGHMDNLNPKRRGPKGSSRYRGVGITKSGKWRAIIYDSRKQRYLGLFDTEVDAAKAYDRGAIEIFGDYANLNFNPIKPTVL